MSKNTGLAFAIGLEVLISTRDVSASHLLGTSIVTSIYHNPVLIHRRSSPMVAET